ncbi:MAG TPA: hypothetical protein VFM46_10820, partial [Pseudomonadales bacterium]|nr:hypothetical protein [Pseudomonadales bacterium]
ALAEAHYKSGHPEKALAIWISLTKRYPHDADSIAAAVYAAHTFASLGDESQALNYFQFARKSGQTELQNTEKLMQDSRWLSQLEQQPDQLGEATSRAQLYDFYARNRGHRLLQGLRTLSTLQHCVTAENNRLNALKPQLQQQLKAWSDELQQLKRDYAQLEQQLKAKKQKVGTMQEVFHTLKTEEVLPQAKIESFGEQVERVKKAEQKRDPVNNYATIEESKQYNLTPYQLAIQSRERQSVRSAQSELVESTHRWLEMGQRINDLEQKIKRVPVMLSAAEKRINQLNTQMTEQQTATRSRLQNAAQYYLAMKQTQLKNILAEAQMGELSLVDKAVHTGQTTPNASQ